MATTYKTDTATNSSEDLQALILGGESGAPKKINKDKTSYSVVEGQTKFTRADNKASFEDFIEMVNRMVQKALARYNAEFSSDEGSRYKVQATETLSNPHIQFSIKGRKPKNDMYAKPKAMEEFTENGDGSRKGIIYSQFFDYEIQFDILASDYITANRVMNAFEDAMFNYTGYFKRNGVSELLFLKQYTDTNLDAYRNTISVRSLVYLVTIDRIRVVYSSGITEVQGEDQVRVLYNSESSSGIQQNDSSSSIQQTQDNTDTQQGGSSSNTQQGGSSSNTQQGGSSSNTQQGQDSILRVKYAGTNSVIFPGIYVHKKN